MATSFWEHTIRDELDYNRHMDYIHFNPVKEALINPHKFWQRQKPRIKAWSHGMLIAFQVTITQSLDFWLSPTG